MLVIPHRGRRCNQIVDIGSTGLAGGPEVERDGKPCQGEYVRQQVAGQCNPTTCEVDYSAEQLAFMQALDRYKRDNHRPHPDWTEVLAVAKALGYRQVEPAGPLPRFRTRLNQHTRKRQGVPRADSIPAGRRTSMGVPAEVALAYADGKLSLVEVARQLGCSAAWAWRLMQRAGVIRRRRPPEASPSS